MKHSAKIILLLLAMFFVAQLIGLYVAEHYSPDKITVYNEQNQTYYNKTTYNVPYGLEPPEDIKPKDSIISIIIAIIFAVIIMLLLMRFKAETFLRFWFFAVVIIGIALSTNAILSPLQYSSTIALIIALPIAYFKIFKRNIIVHNLSEMLIYPGIASVFIPLLDIWTVAILLVIISIYDIYAVWHSGFMQKMAEYQMQKVKVFTGFFIPYISPQDRIKMEQNKNNKNSKKKIAVHVAILGGGDVVFPIILSGVVLHQWGIIPALMIPIGATLALATLFYFSEKGKYYPAMPFISAGCFLALIVSYLIR